MIYLIAFGEEAVLTDVEPIISILIGRTDSADEFLISLQDDAGAVVLCQFICGGQTGWDATGNDHTRTDHIVVMHEYHTTK